jgi:SAM-dependent methyltransferase
MTTISDIVAEVTQKSAESVVCPLCGGTQVFDFLTAPDRFHLRRELYSLVRCSSCSCVWLASPPKPEEMSLHYDEDYHKTIAAGGENSAPNRWQRERDRISSYKSGGAILDIGCSSGGFLGTLKGGSWELYGIEMEASMAAKAKSATGAEIFVGDAVDAPFATESFDVVTCFDVLEHVYHPREFLTKILQWLKPGGILYTILPNIDSWESRMFGSYWYGLELPRHTFHFSPRSLRRVMTELGFQEGCVNTARTSYVERSVGYVCSALLEKVGFSPVPQSKPRPQSLPGKAVRKAMRMTLLSLFGQMASLAGAGASMEAVFIKLDSGRDQATVLSDRVG